ncbi:FAD-dependent monooxygenase [Glycomyces sp. NRRL B-16210]|uniref:FAD-dependent monooxygenase n=1 Tax=Glycomyces sp. NRRL B-16210 TaxID=1463821 RepID=UPI00054F42CD|nr:FAD-dependent monooxygenase [Glycomyces sp. NRRL B-16210]
MSVQQPEVIVVGAGPTGLLLAGDLAEAGVDVTVLEKRGADLSNLSRAFAVHARTLEVLDARGLADELLAKGGSPMPGVNLFGIATLELSKLDSRFPYLLVTPQYHVEAVLRRRAAAAGVRVEHGVEVTGIEQDSSGVTVRTGTGEYRAAYVVGADGVHSAVRTAIDMPFPGKAVLRSLILADVEVDAPPARSPLISTARGAFGFLADFGDGYWRFVAWNKDNQQDDDAPVDIEEITAVARRTFGADFAMHSPKWMSRFHSDERQVPSYRDGRVLLAGDAAHCHSPAGGQGMNTGLQDAANLSWKLAAVLRGAPEPLLDTYHDERHPVGAEVLKTSGALVRFAATGSRALATVVGSIAAVAMRIRPAARRARGRISGIGIHYVRGRGDHRLVGRRAPDIDLEGGSRLYEALRGGRFVVLDGTEDGTENGGVAVHAASAAPDGLTRVVRPDGYIGWAGTDDPAAVRAYLASHAGRP